MGQEDLRRHLIISTLGPAPFAGVARAQVREIERVIDDELLNPDPLQVFALPLGH